MKISTHSIHVDTVGKTSIYDITGQVFGIISKSGLQEGQVCVFAVGSTTGISTLEYEPGLVDADIHNALEHVAPYGKPYRHNHTWGDDNGASHIRSFLVGTSQNFPFSKGVLMLGTWQQIVLADFDTRPRRRVVIVQIMGND